MDIIKIGGKRIKMQRGKKYPVANEHKVYLFVSDCDIYGYIGDIETKLNTSILSQEDIDNAGEYDILRDRSVVVDINNGCCVVDRIRSESVLEVNTEALEHISII